MLFLSYPFVIRRLRRQDEARAVEAERERRRAARREINRLIEESVRLRWEAEIEMARYRVALEEAKFKATAGQKVAQE